MHVRAHGSMKARRMIGVLVAGSILGVFGASVLAFAGAVPEWNEIPLEAGTYREQTTAHRTDTVEIPVGPNGGEIEYMIKMRRGDSLVYSWRAVEIASPDRLTSEFHGHTDRAPGTTGTLIF
jgi:hypothetical protein